MSRSRFWLIAAVSGLLMFALPLTILSAVTQQDPEIRIVSTGPYFSALIVTESTRTLLINSNDRGATRSAIGYLARPWEPKITTLISPADDRAAVGLWEALRLPSVQQVIVIGLPGSDPLWSVIERECADRSVEITFVGEPMRSEFDSLHLNVSPDEDSSTANVIVDHREKRIVLSMSGVMTSMEAHAMVANRAPGETIRADLLILPSTQPFMEQPKVVYVREQEVLTLVLAEDSIAIRGGRFQTNAQPAN